MFLCVCLFVCFFYSINWVCTSSCHGVWWQLGNFAKLLITGIKNHIFLHFPIAWKWVVENCGKDPFAFLQHRILSGNIYEICSKWFKTAKTTDFSLCNLDIYVLRCHFISISSELILSSAPMSGVLFALQLTEAQKISPGCVYCQRGQSRRSPWLWTSTLTTLSDRYVFRMRAFNCGTAEQALTGAVISHHIWDVSETSC